LKAELPPRELDEIGVSYITALIDGLPRSANVEHYARLVRDTARARAVIYLSRTAIATFSEDPGAIGNGAGHRFLEDIRQHIDVPAVGDESWSDSLTDFLETASDAVPPLIEGLVPGTGICLWHGQPRSRKSLVALDVSLSLAAGLPPFGSARLTVAAAVPVWYISEEDPASEVKSRVRKLLAGRAALPPSLFRLSVFKGICLDEPRIQDGLVRDARRHGARLITFDPIRSVSRAVDQGPAELKPLVDFLRRLMYETGAVIILPHHDTKPRSDGKTDERPRAQRASGGGILSISEAPCHFERISDSTTLIVPNLWKSQAPTPLKVRLELGPDVMRLIAEDVPAEAADALALHERIVTALREGGQLATSRVATTVRARKEDVTAALERLAEAGKIDAVKVGNAKRWFLSGGPS